MGSKDKRRLKTRWPNVFRHVTNGNYYLRITDPYGRRQEVVLGTDKAMEVPDKLQRLRDELSTPDKAGRKMKGTQALSYYIEAREDEVKRGELRPRTWHTNKGILERHLIPFFGKYKIFDIDHLLWEQYTSLGLVKDYQNHRSIMTHFLDFCMRKKWLRPGRLTFENPRHQRRRRRPLTDDQIRAVFKHADGRLALFLGCYLFMAMRRAEILRLEWKRVILSDAFSYIVLEEIDTKTGRPRAIPIHPFVKELLVKARRTGPQKWVFPKRGAPNEHAHLDGVYNPWRTLKARCRADGGK